MYSKEKERTLFAGTVELRKNWVKAFETAEINDKAAFLDLLRQAKVIYKYNDKELLDIRIISFVAQALIQNAKNRDRDWLKERMDWFVALVSSPATYTLDGLKIRFVDLIAVGCAEAGDDEMVEELREKHGANANIIALNYAFMGNDKKVQEYIKKHEVPLRDIYCGYTKLPEDYAEKDKKIIDLIKEARSALHTQEAQEHVDAIVYARILHWSVHQNEQSIKTSTTIDNVLQRCISEYGASAKAIASGLEAVGAHDKAKEYNIHKILGDYLDKRKAVTDDSGATQEYKHGKFGLFQKSYKQKDEAIKDLVRAINGETVDLNKHLSTLRNGELGRDLRKFIKLGRANDLVDGKEVKTVTEFVHALHDQVSEKNTEMIVLK